MELVVVNQREVAELLPMPECIDLMEEALAALGRGDAVQPLRPVMHLPESVGGMIPVMPGYIADIDSAGVKVLTVFPQNQGTRYDSHQGAILLFETRHGALLAAAVEDVASAHHIYRKALATRRGTWMEFGGSRNAE